MTEMNDQKILRAIERLGFTENEAKCYLALTRRDSLTVSETAKLSGVPRQNAYKALEQLLLKGLIVLIPHKIKHYKALAPGYLKEKYLNELKSSIEKDFEELENKKREVIETDHVIEELKTLFNSSRGDDNPLEFMEILRYSSGIYHKVIQLLNNARTEILGFTKPPYTFTLEPANTNQEYFEKQIQALNDAVDRGVIIRNIFEIPRNVDELQMWYRYVCDGHNPAIQDRAIDSLPFKMSVYDRRFVLYELTAPVEQRVSMTSLFTDHTSLAEGFVVMFEHYWAKAKSYVLIDGKKYSLQNPGEIET